MAKSIKALITRDGWDTHEKAWDIRNWHIIETPEHPEGVVIVMDFPKNRKVQLTLSTQKLKDLLSLIPGEAVAVAEAPDHGLKRAE